MTAATEVKEFGAYDLPNLIKSLLPLMAFTWETKRETPNPNLSEWGIGPISHAELLILELVGFHEDFRVLRRIHEGKIKEGTPQSLLSAGWHSTETYSRESGYSSRQVRRLLDSLATNHYIDVIAQPGRTSRKRVNRDSLAKLVERLKAFNAETDVLAKAAKDDRTQGTAGPSMTGDELDFFNNLEQELDTSEVTLSDDEL